MEHLEEVEPNGTTHWVLFILQNAAEEGSGPLTAKEVAARDDCVELDYVSATLTKLYKVGGVNRDGLDRPYNPYGYTITPAGRALLAELGTPTHTPRSFEGGRQSVTRTFVAEPTSEETVIPQKIAGPNGEIVERNQTAHWVLFVLAQANELGVAPLPPAAICEMDEALQSKSRVKEVSELFVERGWATAVEKTDYKHKPKGWMLTETGADVFRTLGVPTHYPDSQVHDGEPVERVLLVSVEEQERSATAADETVGDDSLEPDWEWLAERLAALSQYEWAAKARDAELTPREVYGPGGALDILYGEQEMTPA